MTRTKQTNIRLSVFTRRQLDTICRITGMNQSEVIQTAIDRFYQTPEIYTQIVNPFKEMAEYESEESEE